jgi:hypothetical protein
MTFGPIWSMFELQIQRPYCSSTGCQQSNLMNNQALLEVILVSPILIVFNQFVKFL